MKSGDFMHRSPQNRDHSTVVCCAFRSLGSHSFTSPVFSFTHFRVLFCATLHRIALYFGSLHSGTHGKHSYWPNSEDVNDKSKRNGSLQTRIKRRHESKRPCRTFNATVATNGSHNWSWGRHLTRSWLSLGWSNRSSPGVVWPFCDAFSASSCAGCFFPHKAAFHSASTRLTMLRRYLP